MSDREEALSEDDDYSSPAYSSESASVASSDEFDFAGDQGFRNSMAGFGAAITNAVSGPVSSVAEGGFINTGNMETDVVRGFNSIPGSHALTASGPITIEAAKLGIHSMNLNNGNGQAEVRIPMKITQSYDVKIINDNELRIEVIGANLEPGSTWVRIKSTSGPLKVQDIQITREDPETLRLRFVPRQ